MTAIVGIMWHSVLLIALAVVLSNFVIVAVGTVCYLHQTRKNKAPQQLHYSKSASPDALG